MITFEIFKTRVIVTSIYVLPYISDLYFENTEEKENVGFLWGVVGF